VARARSHKSMSPARLAAASGLTGDDALSAAMSIEPPSTRWPSKLTVGPYRSVWLDSIINMLAGAGGPYDKARATEWAFAKTENWQALTNLFRASWLARKVVTARNDDMLRAGVLLDWDGHDPKNKDSDLVKRAISRWKTWDKLREALYYKSLYGGSVIVLGIGSKNAELADLTKWLHDHGVGCSRLGTTWYRITDSRAQCSSHEGLPRWKDTGQILPARALPRRLRVAETEGENMSPLVEPVRWQAFGTSRIAPAGSLANAALFGRLQAYKRGVAGAYRSLPQSRTQSRTGGARWSPSIQPPTPMSSWRSPKSNWSPI
jgi:hypothetical protein